LHRRRMRAVHLVPWPSDVRAPGHPVSVPWLRRTHS
jgi:hypothetical protein